MSHDKNYFQGQHVEWTDLNKDERSRLRPIVGAVIAAMLIGSVLLYAARAWAEEIPVHVHEQDGLSIRLMPGPCVDKNSLAFMGGFYTARLRAIESTWRMQDGSSRDFAGCWMLMTKEEAGAESFFLIFSDGERHLVPKNDFLKKPGQGGV